MVDQQQWKHKKKGALGCLVVGAAEVLG